MSTGCVLIGLTDTICLWSLYYNNSTFEVFVTGLKVEVEVYFDVFCIVWVDKQKHKALFI